MTQEQLKVEVLTERARLAAGREQTVDVLVRITPRLCPKTLLAQKTA